MIAQGFGFTGNFRKKWNNNVYCRVQKNPVDSKYKRGLVITVRNEG